MGDLTSNGRLTYLVCTESICGALDSMWAIMTDEQKVEVTKNWERDCAVYVEGGDYVSAELAAENFNECSLYSMCRQVDLA